jgi:hypothetical protein
MLGIGVWLARSRGAGVQAFLFLQQQAGGVLAVSAYFCAESYKNRGAFEFVMDQQVSLMFWLKASVGSTTLKGFGSLPKTLVSADQLLDIVVDNLAFPRLVVMLMFQ